MSYLKHPANYDKFPSVPVIANKGKSFSGWESIVVQIDKLLAGHGNAIVAIDCYPGVDKSFIKESIVSEGTFSQAQWLDADDCYQSGEALEARLADTLTDDRVFGRMSCAMLQEYLLAEKVAQCQQQCVNNQGILFIIGTGASLIYKNDLLIYVDYPRWQRQLDWRAGGSNWLAENPDEDQLKKYKRGFFWEWRLADRHKRELFDKFDLFLDVLAQPVAMIDQAAFQSGLQACLATPFRLNPFFDPGVWGGKWMEDVCKLPESKKNYAWCFDGVPEENSLTLNYDGVLVTMPSINLVLAKPVELLGAQNYARFGAEFPIRFDFLDTMQGGNLSLQVHPLTDYIQQTFGMHYTQDESYYILDAGEDASVYLGLKTGVKSEELIAAIEVAQQTGVLDDDKYVNKFAVGKHDHVLIPAGTVHCSGNNAMILEISATPYIFTFKLWDWGRLGLDNRPRPVHIEHGRKVIQAERDTQWCREQLLNAVTVKEENEHFTCERTGLHALEFIDTHRYWIKTAVDISTNGGFQMLNLVEGEEVVIESINGEFAPFHVHYAETVIIPAALLRYRIKNISGKNSGVIIASVRRQEA